MLVGSRLKKEEGETRSKNRDSTFKNRDNQDTKIETETQKSRSRDGIQNREKCLAFVCMYVCIYFANK